MPELTELQNHQGSSNGVVLMMLRAIRKVDKKKLNATTKEQCGRNFTNTHTMCVLHLLDRSTPTGSTEPTDANFVVEQPFTCDFMGEWVDRQASTFRQVLGDLRTLGWIETTLDVEGYRGFKQIRVFTVRALLFLKSLGTADTKKIKETRRSKSQKRKRDTRKRAPVECQLPQAWLKFADSRHDAGTNRKDWIACLKELYELGYTLSQLEAHALEEKDTQMDAYDFVESLTDKLGKQVQHIDRSKAFAAELIFDTSVESLKKSRNTKK